MAMSSVRKSKIYIGTSVEAASLAEFEADTYTEIASVIDIGEFGDQANEIAVAIIGAGRITRMKGALDAGVIDLVCGREPLDPGQNALRDALASPLDYNFHILLADLQAAGGTPSEFYFRGPVMSARNVLGTLDNLIQTNFQIAINSDILEVVATVPAP